MNTVDVVIVNYKTPHLTSLCVQSLSNQGCIGQIIVVDNCSDDDSQNIVTEANSSVTWISNKSNEGFGRANNVGSKVALHDFLLFLNSDVQLPDNTLTKCLEFTNSKLGVLGCKLVNDDGTHQKSTYSVASFRKLLDTNLIINKLWPMGIEPVEAVMGSFMLIPRKVFDEVGGFDPDFFMYAEELDLCHRISRRGFKIVYYESAIAIHKNGGSTTDKEWSMKQRYLSNALLFLKVRGYGGYLLYHLLFLLNTLTNFFAMWLLDKGWRCSYWEEQKCYFSNFGFYLKIPFLYSSKHGSGKRMLKRGS